VARTEYNWSLEQIDRSVGLVDYLYREVLGDSDSLLQQAYDRGVSAQAAGEPLRILDVGCGTGNTLRGLTLHTRRHLPNLAIQAVGVNIENFSNKSKSQATRRAIAAQEIAYILGNAAELPLKDGSFDLVYEHELLLHSTGPEAVGRLEEMERVLAPGGRMYFGTDGQAELLQPMRQLRERGYGVQGVKWTLIDPRPGQAATRMLFYVDKPVEDLPPQSADNAYDLNI